MSPSTYSFRSDNRYETVTLAMGCFWKPDALFGGLAGVVKTEVGYAGGETEAPSYWKIGNHLETVQIEIDTSLLSFEQILDLFFTQHNPSKPAWKRQYASAIFYHSPQQKAFAERRVTQETNQRQKEIFTLILPYHRFYPAEDRHQKWYLQRHQRIIQELAINYPEDLGAFLRTTHAARLNAYLAGFLPLPELEALLPSLPIQEEGKQLLLAHVPVVRHCQ